ncbi:unnamed protein product [Peronospora belbahrii]|uniref:Uncharacterized protein n=1 Tax=Peronospora belbahrii TaxID=622444 RepID=A0ABN8D6V9_9STRA|nr:unnamed protein product [Peronospora belbahrii]
MQTNPRSYRKGCLRVIKKQKRVAMLGSFGTDGSRLTSLRGNAWMIRLAGTDKVDIVQASRVAVLAWRDKFKISMMRRKKTRSNAAGALGNFVRNSEELYKDLCASQVRWKLFDLAMTEMITATRRIVLFSLVLVR